MSEKENSLLVYKEHINLGSKHLNKKHNKSCLIAPFFVSPLNLKNYLRPFLLQNNAHSRNERFKIFSRGKEINLKIVVSGLRQQSLELCLKPLSSNTPIQPTSLLEELKSSSPASF